MFDHIKTEANTLMTAILENFEEVEPEALGLDPRSCGTLYRGSDCVIVNRYDLGRFNYYGGGEYVDKDCVTQVGDFVVYSNKDSRVAGWLGLGEEEYEE